MSKKSLIITLSIFCAILLLIAAIILYVPLGRKAIEKNLWLYLDERGYEKDEIDSFKIVHTYIGGLLGYGQWGIEVVYTDEPQIRYSYSVNKDGWFDFNIQAVGYSMDSDVGEDYTPKRLRQ